MSGRFCLPADSLCATPPSTQVPELLAANGERVAVAICWGHRELQIKGEAETAGCLC